MHTIPAAIWPQVRQCLLEHCSRLTTADLAECALRPDLIVARIQFRHWVSRSEAAALVARIIEEAPQR